MGRNPDSPDSPDKADKGKEALPLLYFLTEKKHN
jgi:hypothetical protein